MIEPVQKCNERSFDLVKKVIKYDGKLVVTDELDMTTNRFDENTDDREVDESKDDRDVDDIVVDVG